MTDRAIIQGSFADLKSVKTRSVVQMVIEVPIEEGERIIQAFGFPQPGREVSVAVARLYPKADGKTKATDSRALPAADGGPNVSRALPAATHPPHHDGPPTKRFQDMSRAQQAGMLCADQAFQRYLNGGPVEAADAAEHTADMLRLQLGIASRKDLNTNEAAAKQWDAMVADYRQTTGQMAEQRG